MKNQTYKHTQNDKHKILRGGSHENETYVLKWESKLANWL